MFTAVIDIGTPGKSLGWAAMDLTGKTVDGTDVDVCIGAVSDALRDGAVALSIPAQLLSAGQGTYCGNSRNRRCAAVSFAIAFASNIDV